MDDVACTIPIWGLGHGNVRIIIEETTDVMNGGESYPTNFIKP
jgi:hypothetical protein